MFLGNMLLIIKKIPLISDRNCNFTNFHQQDNNVAIVHGQHALTPLFPAEIASRKFKIVFNNMNEIPSKFEQFLVFCSKNAWKTPKFRPFLPCVIYNWPHTFESYVKVTFNTVYLCVSQAKKTAPSGILNDITGLISTFAMTFWSLPAIGVNVTKSLKNKSIGLLLNKFSRAPLLVPNLLSSIEEQKELNSKVWQILIPPRSFFNRASMIASLTCSASWFKS